MGGLGQTNIKDHLYPAKAGSGADLDTFPTFPAGLVVGWGQTKIKDHLSPAKAEVRAELGKNCHL